MPTSDPRFAVPVTGTRCGCAECHEVFSCVRSFDAHRSGPMAQRICLDPGEVRRRDGSFMYDQVLWVDKDNPGTTKYYWVQRGAPRDAVPPHWEGQRVRR